MPIEPHPTDPGLVVMRAGQYNLHTEKPKRKWVGLEAEDLAQIESDEFWQTGNHMAIAMAVEEKLKEKNT